MFFFHFLCNFLKILHVMRICCLQGQFVNEYVGDLIDEEECRRRLEKSHEDDVHNFYMMTLDMDRWVESVFFIESYSRILSTSFMYRDTFNFIRFVKEQ